MMESCFLKNEKEEAVLPINFTRRSKRRKHEMLFLMAIS